MCILSLRGSRIAPAVPALFVGQAMNATTPEAERRLRLARMIGAKENPLTARVLVNRVWQHNFGTGLVDTPSDFGINGGRPSHPELLDWLATRLVEEKWSVKQLQRRLLNSATFRQASFSRPQAEAIDGDCRGRRRDHIFKLKIYCE